MIDKGENLNILCLLIWRQKMGRPRSATRSVIAVATRQVGK